MNHKPYKNWALSTMTEQIRILLKANLIITISLRVVVGFKSDEISSPKYIHMHNLVIT